MFKARLGKYMTVRGIEVEGGNKTYLIENAKSGAILAAIIKKDDGYCIRSYPNVTFSGGCLGDILDFVSRLKKPVPYVVHSHVVYDEIPTKLKTKRFDVLLNSGSDYDSLGIIKFHPGWRQFCFFPEGDCRFSLDEVADITAFIENLNEERKKEKK